jgi:hypothetical protein
MGNRSCIEKSEMQMPTTENESRAVVIRVAQQQAGTTGVKTDTFPRLAAKNRPLSGSALRLIFVSCLLVHHYLYSQIYSSRYHSLLDGHVARIN